MKLEIRGEKQKEETCELWLEKTDIGSVLLMSLNGGQTKTEVLCDNNGKLSNIGFGNFEKV